MRTLCEQWVEELDGKKHMLKAVDNTYNCNGCAYLGDTGKCLHSSILECPVYRLDAIIKDLGPVNEDGLLACPLCGKYPTEINSMSVLCSDNSHVVEVFGHGNKQANIDAWNRRN